MGRFETVSGADVERGRGDVGNGTSVKRASAVVDDIAGVSRGFEISVHEHMEIAGWIIIQKVIEPLVACRSIGSDGIPVREANVDFLAGISHAINVRAIDEIVHDARALGVDLKSELSVTGARQMVGRGIDALEQASTAAQRRATQGLVISAIKAQPG